MKRQDEVDRQYSTSGAIATSQDPRESTKFSRSITKALSSFISFFTVKREPRIHWLDTPEGKAFEDLGEQVYEQLDFFKVDARKRLFCRGKTRMALDQVIQQVAVNVNESVGNVSEHILMYMMEASESADPNFEGTQEHVDMMQHWADEERKRRGIVFRF